MIAGVISLPYFASHAGVFSLLRLCIANAGTMQQVIPAVFVVLFFVIMVELNDTFEYLAENLIPDTEYKGSIAIKYNKKFNKKAVLTLRTRRATVNEVPSPGRLSISLESLNSAFVSWNAPVLTPDSPRFINYSLRLENLTDESFSTLNVAQTSVVLTNLKSDTHYRLLLRAIYQHQTGSKFVEKNFDTFRAKPYASLMAPSIGQLPKQPLYLNVGVTSNSISLTWRNDPTGRSVLDTYLIEWGRITPKDNSKEIPGESTSHIISGLQPNTDYKISITRRNSFGNADPLIREAVTASKDSMATDRLSIPMALEVLETGSRVVSLSWQDPDVHNQRDTEDGRIYQILLKLEHESKTDENSFYFNSSSPSATLTTLRPATSYTVRVRTFRQNAMTQWSLATSFNTHEEEPGSAPADLTFRVMADGSSVQLSWQPPVEPNGHIKKYIIFYTVDDRLDMSNWLVKSVSGEELNTVVTQLRRKLIYSFKMRAENSKGLSPWSSLKWYRAPDRSGLGGGEVLLIPRSSGPPHVVLKNAQSTGINPVDPSHESTVLQDSQSSESPIKSEEKLSLSDRTWWIIIGCVFFAAMILIVVIIIVVCLCRPKVQRGRALQQEATSNGYKPGSKLDTIYQQQQTQALLMQQGQPLNQVKSAPPDLFIHTQKTSVEQAAILEMRQFSTAGCGGGSVDGDSGSDRLLGGGSGSLGGRRDSSDGEGSDRGIFGNGGQAFGQTHMASYFSRRVGNQHARGKTLHMPLEMGRGAQPIPPLVTAVHGTPQPPLFMFPRVNAADFTPQNLNFSSPQQPQAQQAKQPAAHHTRHSRQPSSERNHASLSRPDVASGFDSATSDSAGEMSATTAFSTEELIAEVANLEGLMKDLNVMTQKEFEC